ncbi:MAG: hypothetical protein R2822_11160 [Spirosomataceae bacterium]
MNKFIWYILGATGLGLTIVPAILVFNGMITPDTHKNYMIAGMLIWFISATKLIKR